MTLDLFRSALGIATAGMDLFDMFGLRLVVIAVPLSIVVTTSEVVVVVKLEVVKLRVDVSLLKFPVDVALSSDVVKVT